MVDFGANAGRGVVERLSSPLILCAPEVLVASSVLSQDDALAHSTRYRIVGLASSVVRCLNHAFVERLEVPAHQTASWLRSVRRGRGHNSRRCPIDGVASTVAHMNRGNAGGASGKSLRGSLPRLQIMMDQHFLVATLIGRMVQAHLLRANLSFVVSF